MNESDPMSGGEHPAVDGSPERDTRSRAAPERLYPRTSLARVVALAIPSLVLVAVAYGGWLLWGADHHVLAILVWVALVVPALILLLDWLDAASNLVHNPAVDEESEVTKADRAAAWEEADERTRAARDWLLRHLEFMARHFEDQHKNYPDLYPGEGRTAAVWRAAGLRVERMYPTDPLLERFVALDDKGFGARAYNLLGHDNAGRKTNWGRSTSDLVEAIVQDGEEWWGQRPPGAEGEVPAWGIWLEDGQLVPLRADPEAASEGSGSTA